VYECAYGDNHAFLTLEGSGPSVALQRHSGRLPGFQRDCSHGDGHFAPERVRVDQPQVRVGARGLAQIASRSQPRARNKRGGWWRCRWCWRWQWAPRRPRKFVLRHAAPVGLHRSARRRARRGGWQHERFRAPPPLPRRARAPPRRWRSPWWWCRNWGAEPAYGARRLPISAGIV
jgi:hypothetical protein